MSTYTIHPQERHRRATEWTARHPLASTVAALAAAVLAGALIGILFSMLLHGPEPSALHRAGGHALATVTAAQHDTVAVITPSEGTVIAARNSSTRSPARGGFAVGRSAGAGTGVIVIDIGTRAPARGGFPGRSLGASGGA